MSEGKEGQVLTAYHAKALVLHLGDADPEIGAALRAIASGSHVVVPAPAAAEAYCAVTAAEPSVPQGSKVEPRKCTWGDQMGGCQGHPDDCQCVQPAVAAAPEALTAAYERGWNAGYKSGKPVPQGMVLVPVEAPDEMLAAGAKTLSLYRDDMVSDATITDNIYRAMLSAAPPPDAPRKDLGASSVSGEPGPHHSASDVGGGS